MVLCHLWEVVTGEFEVLGMVVVSLCSCTRQQPHEQGVVFFELIM